jgi:hypothetical protein
MQRSIERTLRRCEKAQRCALDDGSALDWHRWRRRIRRLGQQHGVLVACSITLDGLLPPQRKLARLLGESQDLSMLLEQIGSDKNLPTPLSNRLFDSLRSARDTVNGEIRNPFVVTPAPLVDEVHDLAQATLRSQIPTIKASSRPRFVEESVP